VSHSPSSCRGVKGCGGSGLGRTFELEVTMRKLFTCLLLLTPLLLGGCLGPTPQAVIDPDPKPSQGVIWLQDYPAEVQFDASKSTGEIVSYQWTVLDESESKLATGTGEQFTYEFSKFGCYQVRLEITTAQGETDDAQVEVIANKPPVAVITGPIHARKGETVTFSAEGSYDPDNSIVKYQWDFGDGHGSWGSEPEVEHKFDLPERVSGQWFTVTLAVIDDLGGISESTDTHEIWIVGGCCAH